MKSAVLFLWYDGAMLLQMDFVIADGHENLCVMDNLASGRLLELSLLLAVVIFYINIEA